MATPAATYFDGVSARPHPVELRIADGQMDIVGTDGGVVARWPVAEVRLVDRPAGSEAPRLRRSNGGDDRLTLASRDDLPWLAAHCRHLDRPAIGTNSARRSILLWSLAAAASLIVIVAVLLPRFAGSVAAWVPEAVAQRLGAATEEQVIDLIAAMEGAPADHDRRCTGAAGMMALAQVVDRLARELDRPLKITVTVINSRMVNALALPGGRIVLFRGLIEEAAKLTGHDGAEALAGILAHEMGHIVRRDALALTIENAGLAMIASLIVGDAAGGVLIAGLGHSMLSAAHVREAERRADATAVALLNRAGIRGLPLAELLGRATKNSASPDGAWGLLSTHPGGTARTAEIARTATGHGTAMDAAAWAAIRRICVQ